MRRLEQLRTDHADAVLAFERENRAYFAASITDRGEEYFAHFRERHEALLAEQEAGSSVFFVLVDDGKVVGRFNVYGVEHGAATLGYRVAQDVAGQGVATATVRDLCVLAADFGLHTLTAATAHDNIASQRVLLNHRVRGARPGRTGRDRRQAGPQVSTPPRDALSLSAAGHPTTRRSAAGT